MHIAEGFLPVLHAVGWSALASPFVVHGARTIKRRLRQHPELRLYLGAAGAFTFLLSALKLPSLAGSSSHPTGTGLGAILFGPSTMSVLVTMVLLFQALLLAHGGLTTLGANVCSMGIVGPWVSAIVFRSLRGARLPFAVTVFAGAALGDLATYATTAFQMALAFPDPTSGILGAFVKFASVFAVVQIPLALGDGALTVLVLRALSTHSFDELERLGLFGGRAA